MELDLSEECAPPPIPNDFGFNYPVDYVFETASLLLHYKILPRGTAWQDQDPFWVEDFKLWLAIRNRLFWERQQQKADDTSDSGTTENYTSIMDM